MATARERILDWLATGASAGGVVGALVAFDLIQRVAIVFGPSVHQRAVSGMARAIDYSVRLGGTRMRVEGLANVDPTRNYIIVANHQSLLDISMTSDYLAFLQPRYVSKRELARGIPGVSFNLARGGSALIDRKDPKQAHEAIESLAHRVRTDGWTAAIFPEGTRSKTGAMKPFREAGLRTLVANAPGVAVLPITTHGGSKLFSRDLKPIVRGVELLYRVHPPVLPPDPADAIAFTAFVRQLERTIASALPGDDPVTTDD